ncbi:MAG: hypothetical protein WAK57_13485, partial [Desulfobacterales bacterium]
MPLYQAFRKDSRFPAKGPHSIFVRSILFPPNVFFFLPIPHNSSLEIFFSSMAASISLRSC